MRIGYKSIVSFVAVLVFVSSVSFSIATAAPTPDLTQAINSGLLATDIRDASKATVAAPTFGMSATSFSFNCQTSTGTLGENAQRIYLDNPDAADNGWTLTAAATGGATSLWQNTGNTAQFDFNDPTGAPSGCADGVDADSRAGQMTVNPAVSTLTADCSSCVASNITKGSSAAFSQGVLDSVTLLTAASGSDDVGRWYLTGVNISQTVPGEQPADNYSFNLTITATAS